MPSLKPSSITSFFAAKPSTIAKTRKLQVIEIDDDDEDPTDAVIVVDNAGTEQDNRLVDVTFVVDGDVLLVSFHVLANPGEQAKVFVRNFVSAWSDANKYLVYDKVARGMHCSVAPHSYNTHCWVRNIGREASSEFGREAPEFFLAG